MYYWYKRVSMSTKSRNKSAVNVTPTQRVAEFGSKTFCVEGGLFWCKVCDVPVDHVRKQTISDHVQSAKHKAKNNKRQQQDETGAGAPSAKRQATITGCQERMTEASAAKEKLVLNLVEAFMSANIPLEKLDNPKMREFVNTSIKGGGGVPLANTLREKYVPKLYTTQREEMTSKLQGKKVAVIVDETTDTMGRYVVNVLMQPLDTFDGVANCRALLVNTEFLNAVNNSTMAQVVIRSLTNINIEFDNVLAFVSDNASYMKKCFQDGLKGILRNAHHVTCWAHIVFLVGDEFRTALHLSDELVATVKAIFSKAPGRRARYLNHLRQSNPEKVSLPPVPVITRWNTWFEAALYHGEHLDDYISFVEAETEHGSTQQLRKLSALVNGEQLLELRAELEFLAVHCERLIKILKSLESREFKAADIYNKMRDLHAWLHNPGFPVAITSCEDAMQNAAGKLSEYLEGNKQPAITLFKAVRVFDPRQLPLLSHTLSEYVSIIPSFAAAADEWPVYIDVVTQDLLPDDILLFWQSMMQQNRLTKLASLARAYLAIPVASVDVERSFSKYGSVLSPLRCALAPDSLKAYCSVFYNNN